MTRRLDGLSPDEQEIEREKHRTYYRANRERMLAQSKAAQKKRYWGNREAILERRRIAYAATKGSRAPLTEEQRARLRERERRRYQRNRETILAWRHKNRDKILAQQRAGYHRNKERVLAKQRERREARKLEKASIS